MNKRNLLRLLVNRLDRVAFQWWIFRFSLGYRLWGAEFWQCQLRLAPSRYLHRALKYLGATIAETATVKSGLCFDNLERGLIGLQIEERSYVGPGVFLDLAAPITIETEAVLGPQVMLLTHGDVGARKLANYIARKEGPVVLKQGCWVGARAIILPGVTVGEGAVVGAGAVVTRDVPPFTMVAGVPAQEIKKIVSLV